MSLALSSPSALPGVAGATVVGAGHGRLPGSVRGLTRFIVQSVKTFGALGRASALLAGSTKPDQQAASETVDGAMPQIFERAAAVMFGQPVSGGSHRL